MDGYEWQLIDIEAFGKGPVCPVYEVSSIYYSSVGEAVESATLWKIWVGILYH